MSSVTAALLGTGLFAQDVYVRLLAEYKTRLLLKAAWSRTQQSADAFVAKFAPESAPLAGEDGMNQIMADPSIELVIVVLPVQSALQAVQAALAAGKHVVEEKPVAPTVDEALQALQVYRQQTTPAPLWLFAENYRYEAVFLEGATLVSSGALGKIIKLDLVADMPMNPANKYYSTSWRRDLQGCPGGQLMESSVHFIAALRLIAGAAGLGEATQASAHAGHVREDLTAPDTLVGLVKFPGKDGQDVAAGVSISLAAAHVRWSLSVVGTRGSCEMLRGGWGGSRGSYTLNVQLEGSEATSKQLGFSGTNREMRSFLDLIDRSRAQGGQGVVPDALLDQDWDRQAARASPEEGVRDLAVLEAMLQSSQQGGSFQTVRPVPGASLCA